MMNKHELLNAPSKKANAQEWRKQRDADNLTSDHTDTVIGEQFIQHGQGNHFKGTDVRTIPHIIYFKCNYEGCYSDQYPDENGGEGQDAGEGNVQ